MVVEAIPAASGGLDDPFGALRGILLLTDLGRPSAFGAGRLRIVFGPTNAEARLADHMARGEDIDAAAAALGITRHTARSQLKTIFAKTDTHRQAELVALLARLRAGPSAPGG